MGIDSTIAAESGNDPNAQNSRSSAGGLGQFIDSTWLSVLKQHRPDLAEGRSDNDLLALKFDPALSREMVGAYRGDNQAILSNAGVPVTEATLHLAHFAGPGGAVKILQADPNAPVSQVLGAAAIQANPFLAGMTAQGLHEWAARKAGGSAGQPTAAPASSASPLNAIPPPASPVFAPPVDPKQADSAQFGVQAAAPFEIPPIQAAPILTPPRRPIDLAKLRAAFSQPNFYRS